MSKSSNDRLVWLDLEMTGLDVDRHVIVEIACLVTDSDLQPLDDGLDLVVTATEGQLVEMSDYVQEMHRRSGLTDEIRSTELTLDAAGKQVLDYVASHVASGSAPLCGNSIGMDRRFLARYLPELDDHLHYRNVDVSSFKELCRRWYPKVYKKRPDKSETHRAMEDIRESLAELVYYRRAMLRSDDSD